ncbi:hypothetical protein [Nitrincola alkalisediminis]|uniref:hypothetical protein n=1 Tax=Nitrincola alkalisediminis TaxID=1366656 RepID=UPI001873F48B|nr:hypothetical protein [Nitrincola alkalisediminis]
MAGEYAFPHDRIQQAAFGLMDTLTLQKVHLSIAQYLETQAEMESHLLDCVYHYTAALDRISDPQQLIKVGQLNLRTTRLMAIFIWRWCISFKR